MLNYNLPLTEAESKFAAEHHATIYEYLNKARLPENDFYDIVVFGYLRAVRKIWPARSCGNTNFPRLHTGP